MRPRPKAFNSARRYGKSLAIPAAVSTSRRAVVPLRAAYPSSVSRGDQLAASPWPSSACMVGCLLVLLGPHRLSTRVLLGVVVGSGHELRSRGKHHGKTRCPERRYLRSSDGGPKPTT